MDFSKQNIFTGTVMRRMINYEWGKICKNYYSFIWELVPGDWN